MALCCVWFVFIKQLHANVHLLLFQQSKTIKNAVIYFDQALGALLCLVCPDQGSLAHVCSVSSLDFLTVGHKCHVKHSPYNQESDHTIIVSQYNADYNMVSEKGVMK